MLLLSNFYAARPISQLRSSNLDLKRIELAYQCTKAVDRFLRVDVEKAVRLAVLLCSLLLVNTTINALIIVLGGKGF